MDQSLWIPNVRPQHTFVYEAEKLARLLPFGSPPVPVGHPEIGKIGVMIPGRGFRVQGMSTRSLNALLKDEIRARKALRELGAITTWDGVLSSRAGGKADDFLGYKASQTTVANVWSCFYRSSGNPAAGAYTNIPGGAVHNQASAGAWPLIKPASGDKKYLLNVGTNHATGTNVVLVADLLVAAGNINANSASVQTINTTALLRKTDAIGVMMTLEVTTALSTTAANVTITYTNSASQGSRSTGAIAMTTSCIVYRLQPVAGGALIALQAGDVGVQSVQTLQFSAAMGAGVVALLLYLPICLIPTLATTTYVERSTPGMLSGISELYQDASQNVSCLTFLVLTSTTSTGVQTYFTQTVSG